MKKIVLITLFLFSQVGMAQAVTLDELRALVATVKQQKDALVQATNDLDGFIRVIERNVSPNNPFLNVMFPNPQNVDNFVNLQTPIYIQRLTDIEIATDALGTDPLH